MSVLLVTGPDDRGAAEALADAVGDDTLTTTTSADARAAVRADDPACVVCVPPLDDGSAFDVFAAARTAVPDVDCIVYGDPAAVNPPRTGDPPVADAVDARREDAGEMLADAVTAALPGKPDADYPVPDGEAERLEAVARYADPRLGGDTDLARFVVEAADGLDAPRAALALVAGEDRHVLAGVGPDPADDARAGSPCAHALLEEDALAVPDLAEGPGHPAGGLSAYLGAPVRTPAGHAVGTLSVRDRDPRTFRSPERRRVRAYADAAGERLAAVASRGPVGDAARRPVRVRERRQAD